MQHEYDFLVSAPPDAVFAHLIDVERMVACVPGATLEGRNSDGEYEGTIRVKVGPITVSYRGHVALVPDHTGERAATLEARAREVGAQGSARATTRLTVADDRDGGSRVSLKTTFEITGRVARFGRSLIDDVARRMIEDLAACVSDQLTSPGRTASGQTEASPHATGATSASSEGRAMPQAGQPLDVRRLIGPIGTSLLRRIASNRRVLVVLVAMIGLAGALQLRRARRR